MLFKLTRDNLKFHRDSNLINLYFLFFQSANVLKCHRKWDPFYSSYSQSPTDLWKFTKKIDNCISYGNLSAGEIGNDITNLRIGHKTNVRQDFFKAWFCLLPCLSNILLSVIFFLTQIMKNMHFQQDFHQEHQNFDIIFSSFLSGSCSPLYS